jgi:hypothetical protein
MNMVNAQPAGPNPTRTSSKKAPRKPPQAAALPWCPSPFPLLTGPASMSTVVIYADRAQTFWLQAALVGHGVVIGLATALCFSLADPIARVLGKKGIRVTTRLMGWILAALAVQVMADGLGKLLPMLGTKQLTEHRPGVARRARRHKAMPDRMGIPDAGIQHKKNHPDGIGTAPGQQPLRRYRRGPLQEGHRRQQHHPAQGDVPTRGQPG